LLRRRILLSIHCLWLRDVLTHWINLESIDIIR
jgi:hypothetical protein